MAMAYGSFSLEPVGAHRVNPVPPVAASLRVAARADGRSPARGGAVDAPAQPATPPVEIAPLSATALRAQAVSGLLEARRTDLVGAERAVGAPGAAARRSLADVWPEEDRDRPDARAAADVSLTRDDEGASSRKRSDKARREAAIRADLITQAAVAEAAASAAALDEAHAERAERAAQGRSADGQHLATQARAQDAQDAQDAQARRAAAMAGAGRVSAAPAEPAEAEARRRDDDPPSSRRDVTLADVARAADDVRRLRDAVTSYARTLREGIERGAAEVTDLGARVAELNGRISDAVDSGRPVPQDANRQREQLIVSLARLTGATIQPGARSSVDVLVDGRTLVSGEQSWPLVTATGVDGKERLGFADGRGVSLSSGVLASRLGTHNGMLATLAGASSAVLSLLAEQAADPAGAGAAEGPAAAAGLGGLLREVAHAAESSAAYAQVAAGVENLVSRLAQGDVPAVVRGSNLLLGAVEGPAAAAAPPSLPSAASMGSLRAALAALGKATADAAVPGATAPTTRVTSGAPGLATPIVAADAPTGLATVRVLSVAVGGAVASAQSFHPDTPLGDGHETTIGIVQGLGTPQEHTIVVDVGRYPTPADLVSSINQASVEVRASLNRLTGGTVQLHLESLRTGRGHDITIISGSQPPAASQVLGRVVQLTGARDTLLEVQRAGRTAAVMSSSSTRVDDVLPGVSLDVHRADPSRAFQVGLTRQAGPAVATAETLVQRAGAAMTAARAAGAPGTADAVLAALGLGGAPGAGTPGAGPEALDGGRLAGRAALPGVHLDRRGNPALDRRELAGAFEADPAGTSGALTATARALSAVAANTDGATWEAYLTARAAQGPDPLATYTADTRRTGRDDAVATELSRREQALLAVLNRLQDQGEWLGGQLAAGTS